MAAPKEIVELVERFDRYAEAYKSKSSKYNETQVRREFIDPFFIALGWDVDNVQGLSLAYRDVIHEDSIKIGDSTNAPDYSFRIGGIRKFFVEAKAPSVNLKDGINPAFQLRRYAWSAMLVLSILTDFEELVVYDGWVAPNKTDNAYVARYRYFTYKEYVEKWDEIAGLLSRDAVLGGSIERYPEISKIKRPYVRVDDAFLEEIANWRKTLAEDIASKNLKIGTNELNIAVQATIDRIIFLRICEDRGIEKYRQLQALIEGDGTYQKLCELFIKADDRYNSGLFHFQVEPDRTYPDTSTLKLKIDDKVIKGIIERLYYPDSPYEFSVLPIEILGQVYEQFLGKVIRLTEDHKAVVEDKPEVKKAGGVYYTPSFIVDYIVHQTVVKQTEGKTPNEVSGIRVLDPACGSGSFLIGAYQHLLDWHRDWYAQNLMPLLESGEPETSPKVKKLLPSEYIAEPPKTGSRRKKRRSFQSLPIYQASKGYWPLTADEKKRVLLNNIYGVDLDPQAVEVTKLSLLLKVLEGENTETVQTLIKFTGERALPDLDNNIKCGNTLVGWDIWNNYPNLPDEIMPFDWNSGFQDIMQSGGFDAVIGNPPYIRIQTIKEHVPLIAEYYKRTYTTATAGNFDIYVVFVEKSLSLLNPSGCLGFIVPHKFFNAKYGDPLRAHISSGKHLSEIVHFGDHQVFSNATTYTCLLFLTKSGVNNFRLVKPNDIDRWKLSGEADEGWILADEATNKEWNFSIGNESMIFDRLAKIPARLEDISERISQGIRTSANEIYVLDLASITDDVIYAKSEMLNEIVEIEKESVLWFLQGREIKRYSIQPSGKIVIMPYTISNRKATLIPEVMLSERFPRTYEYLCKNKNYLSDRERGRFKGDGWYAYGRNQNIDLMPQPKILVPDIASHVSFMVDEIGKYAFTSGYGITLKADLPESEIFILGLLNSKLSDFYLKRRSTQMRGGFYKYETRFIRSLPIRKIDFLDPSDKSRHDHIVSLVQSMLDLNKRLADAQTSHEKTMLQRQIEATDRQIDKLVYELYGLTEEEIKIVESAT